VLLLCAPLLLSPIMNVTTSIDVPKVLGEQGETMSGDKKLRQGA
jgi:hypothetical protein